MYLRLLLKYIPTLRWVQKGRGIPPTPGRGLSDLIKKPPSSAWGGGSNVRWSFVVMVRFETYIQEFCPVYWFRTSNFLRKKIPCVTHGTSFSTLGSCHKEKAQKWLNGTAPLLVLAQKKEGRGWFRVWELFLAVCFFGWRLCFLGGGGKRPKAHTEATTQRSQKVKAPLHHSNNASSSVERHFL